MVRSVFRAFCGKNPRKSLSKAGISREIPRFFWEMSGFPRTLGRIFEVGSPGGGNWGDFCPLVEKSDSCARSCGGNLATKASFRCGGSPRGAKRRRRSFAALRMTGGKTLRITRGGTAKSIFQQNTASKTAKSLLFAQTLGRKQAVLRGATQIQRSDAASSDLRGCGKGTAVVSDPVQPLSSAPLFRAGLSAIDPVLCPKGGCVLMRRHHGWLFWLVSHRA